jgi:hypothetical protein
VKHVAAWGSVNKKDKPEREERVPRKVAAPIPSHLIKKTKSAVTEEKVTNGQVTGGKQKTDDISKLVAKRQKEIQDKKQA